MVWDEGFRCLQEYYRKYSNCNVPVSYKENDFRLGSWVSAQRRNPKRLTAEQLAKLDELGFVWDPVSEMWNIGFGKLQQFQEREGHCSVNLSHVEDNFRLGSWVSAQRRNKDIQAAYRIEKLDALGFIWEASAAQWEEGYVKLQQYLDKEGHCVVPQGHNAIGGFNLGYWVRGQRANKNDLSSEKINRLDALGFIWSFQEWASGFRVLQQYHAREGNCRVPQGCRVGDFHLGYWVRDERDNKERMSLEHIEKLNALGFVWGI